MSEKFSLKDHLFNQKKIQQLAGEIQAVYPSFQSQEFENEVIAAFPNLALKERIAHIRQCLGKYLPQDYQKAVKILLAALPAPLDENRTDDDFGDFIYAPYHDFVAHDGCKEEYLDFSLAALKELTKRFSAEDAIRYFLNAFPEKTLATLLVWAKDKNYHLRRLCSEGTRPKLPWSQKIHIKTEAVLPILDLLFADNTRYVTRSVANHLNDIAKTEPDIVVETLQRWQKSQKQNEKEMQFICKHALRTLVKNGNAQALSLLGFDNSEAISISKISHHEQVTIGEALHFSFEIECHSSKNVVIDYILYFQSKQGTLSNKKVFKLQNLFLTANIPTFIQKRHLFRANMTTRPLYAGEHKLEIQVNGAVLGGFSFILAEK